MTTSALTRVQRRRLTTQRLTSPGLSRSTDVVRLLLAVQSQDAPLAAWSLGLRTSGAPTYRSVLNEQGEGGWVRTHVLRPTWHFVATEDLRWLQRLTGSKVERSLASRHRQLDLDERSRDRAIDTLAEILAGSTPLTRPEIAAAFADRKLPASSEQVGHQLMVAELRAVICSGPPRGTEHTYVLVDESVPRGPLDGLAAEDAALELVRRFFSGHGPASERDLLRWSTLTLHEIRACLDALSDTLEAIRVDDELLWFDPAQPGRASSRRGGALLVPTFDEATLTYASTAFPRRDPAVARPRLVTAIGGGTVILRGEDVGAWRRTVREDCVEVKVSPDTPLPRDDIEEVRAAATDLAVFVERDLRLTVRTVG